MQIHTEKVGAGLTTHQLKIAVKIGIPVPLQVVCRSASRNDTSYEILDENLRSMGVRRLTYATGRLNGPLVDDLNVLLEEFDAKIEHADFSPVSEQIVKTCEARYGHGIADGDVIVLIH